MPDSWESGIIQTGFSEGMFFPTTGFATIGGDMGSENTDFEVSEIPAYLPSGQGDHLYLWIEKNGKSTQNATKAIEEIFHVKEIDVGCAGKKDVHAITRQWISVQTQSDGAEEIKQINELGWMKVLQASRHTNKIRMGHLRGNRFQVRLYNVQANDEQILQAIKAISQTGFINYFGKQRFGFDGDNVFQGIRMLKGGKARHQMQKLYVSALQSAIFNLAASRRYEETGFGVLNGDVLQKLNAGCFVCDDPETDNQRVINGEIAVTIALPGKKVMKGKGRGEEIEQNAMKDLLTWWADKENSPEILNPALLGKLADGTRRTLSCHPDCVSFKRIGDTTVSLDFSLPSGSFATIFLRHLCGSSFTR